MGPCLPGKEMGHLQLREHYIKCIERAVSSLSKLAFRVCVEMETEEQMEAR